MTTKNLIDMIPDAHAAVESDILYDDVPLVRWHPGMQRRSARKRYAVVMPEFEGLGLA